MLEYYIRNQRSYSYKNIIPLTKPKMRSFHNIRDESTRNTIGKYFNPSTLIQPKNQKVKNNISNAHCRSMEDLDLSHNLASHSSIRKQNLKTNIHHQSLFSQNQNGSVKMEPNKSKSLSKFIALFQNSNILKTKTEKEENGNEKAAPKRKNYNGFSYDLKISANSNMRNDKLIKKKDKQNILHNLNTIKSQRQLNTLNSSKSILVAKKQNLQNSQNIPKQLIINQQKGRQSADKHQQALLKKMKQIIEQQKAREMDNIQKIQYLQQKNVQLQNEVNQYQHRMLNIEQRISKYAEKQMEMQRKMKDLQSKNKIYNQKLKFFSEKQQKSLHRQCKEHDYVIKSLKKVVNEQLNKIIELERFKIQNQGLLDYLREHQDNTANLQSHRSNGPYDQDRQYNFSNQASQNKQFTTDNITSKSCQVGQFSRNNQPAFNMSITKQKNNISLFKKNLTRKKSGQSVKQPSNMQLKHTHQETDQYPYFKNGSSKVQTSHAASKEREYVGQVQEVQSSFSQEPIRQLTEENEQLEQALHNQRGLVDEHRQEYLSNSNKSSFLREEEDSILEQVDEYLSKWRHKK